MATEVPPSNGLSCAHLSSECPYVDRLERMGDDIREMRDLLYALRDHMVGGINSTTSHAARISALEREHEDRQKVLTIVKQVVAGILIAILSPLLVWVAQMEFHDHILKAPPAVSAPSPAPSPPPVLMIPADTVP